MICLNRFAVFLAACITLLLMATLAVAQTQQQAGQQQGQPGQQAASAAPASQATTRPQWRRRAPQVFHVAPSGSDTNAGSAEQPFKTIQKGCDSLQGGDTLTIAGGTYAEYVKLTRSGSYLGRQITIQAAPGEKVIIDGGVPLVPPQPQQQAGATTRPNSGSAYRGTAAIFDTNGQDHLRIIGLDVRNGGTCGIRVWSSWQVDVENCRTSDTPGSGIMVDKSGMVNVRNCEVTRACGGDGTPVWNDGSGEESISVKRSQDVLVDGCHVHHTHHEGIDVKEGSKHVRVRNNHVHHVQRQALYADSWDSPTFDIRFESNVVHDCMFGLVAGAETGGLLSDVWFINNVVYDLRGPGMIVQDWGAQQWGHPMKDIYFINNTVYKTGAGGRNGDWGSCMVFENDQAENVVVMNNIFSASPQPQMRIAKGKKPKSWTVQNNLIDGPTEDIGEKNLTGSPKFADPAAGDFRLQPGSPAIDAGVKEHAPSVDAAGSARPAGRGVDLGAYEAAQ